MAHSVEDGPNSQNMKSALFMKTQSLNLCSCIYWEFYFNSPHLLLKFQLQICYPNSGITKKIDVAYVLSCLIYKH